MFTQFNRILEKDISAKSLYTSLFLQNHSIMLLIDPATSQIVDANLSACTFYKYSKEEIIKLYISEINTLTKNQIEEEMRKAIQEKRNHFIFKHKLKNGAVKDVEVYSSPIEINDQKLLFSIISDISKKLELKRTHEKIFSDLQKANDEIQKLQEVIPVCSYCKKIRNREGTWDTLEKFIEKESDTFVSHGICPECYEIEIEKIKKKNP